MGQKMAIERQSHLILIESDVIIRSNTITDLISIAENVPRPGLVGLATVDHYGRFNFPYSYLKENEEIISETSRSLSFCCTLLSLPFIKEYSFENLPSHKDWYDIFISRQARKSGFKNYLIKKDAVLHIPHSSRPWKQLKYTHPFRYYLHKILLQRDRI
jgi:GT2 family glycosyltransferase